MLSLTLFLIFDCRGLSLMLASDQRSVSCPEALTFCFTRSVRSCSRTNVLVVFTHASSLKAIQSASSSVCGIRSFIFSASSGSFSAAMKWSQAISSRASAVSFG